MSEVLILPLSLPRFLSLLPFPHGAKRHAAVPSSFPENRSTFLLPYLFVASFLLKTVLIFFLEL